MWPRELLLIFMNALNKFFVVSLMNFVAETRMELEILDEMVRALNDRKLNIFAAARGHLDRSLTPG